MRARFASFKSSTRTADRRRGPSRRQRGAAIISALLVVTLSAILVAGVLWRQQVQIRRIQNQRLLSQAQWVARGAVDWTRLILRSEADTAPTVTYLGGIWAVPIAKTRLSDFLGKSGQGDAAEGAQTYISGSIEKSRSPATIESASPPSVQGITFFQSFPALCWVNPTPSRRQLTSAAVPTPQTIPRI